MSRLFSLIKHSTSHDGECLCGELCVYVRMHIYVCTESAHQQRKNVNLRHLAEFEISSNILSLGYGCVLLHVAGSSTVTLHSFSTNFFKRLRLVEF